jgi:hypothetical protein
MCADTSLYTITGRTVGRGVIKGVSLNISDTSRAMIGSVVKIPVELHSAADLASSTTTQLKIYISYNPTVLAPQSVLDFRDNFSGTISNLGANRTEITVNSDKAIQDTGYLFSIAAKVYLGEALYSDVSVDSVVATGMEINGIPGKVTVIGDCMVHTKTIALGKPASIILNSVAHSELEFSVVTLTDEPAKIELYGIDGRWITTLADLMLKPGEHIITSKLPVHARGAYMILFRHGRHVQSIPLLIQ